MKVLITGFDPFGGEKINPAFEAVKKLPDTIAGADIIKVEVPTVFGASGQKVADALAVYQPDVVICVGQADGRPTVTVEKVAINLAEARIPDNNGQQPSGVPLKEDGQTAYFTNLPIKAMVKNCHDHQLPAAISYTAGTFVCNDIMYNLLYQINTQNLAVRGGFIHVPFLPEQTIDKPNVASMSLEAITKALYYMVEAAITTDTDIQLTSGTTH
ncbi:pyroglutamyl-peptidase I [Enterococcus faecalis]